MRLIKISVFFFLLLALNSCANNEKIIYDKDSGKFILIEKKQKVEKKFFHSSYGFALIYDRSLYKEGIIDKKLDIRNDIDKRINDTEVIVMHSFLKKNTPV